MAKYSKKIRETIILTLIFFSLSCQEKYIESRFHDELLYKINVDKIKCIDVFPREDSILVARFKMSNDLDYIQILCKSYDRNDLYFYYKKQWMSEDSIYNYIETTNEINIINRIKYAINLFLDLKSINYDFGSRGIRIIAPNGCIYYNVNDKDIIIEFEKDSLINKIGGNWWIEKQP